MQTLIRWVKRLQSRVTVAETALSAVEDRLVTPVIVSAVSAPVSAAAANDSVVLSNLGAVGAAAFTLPPATAGMRVGAVVEAAQELRITPNGTETIALPSTGVQGAAGKYLVADAVGESIELVCLTEGTWSCLSATGTWTAEP